EEVAVGGNCTRRASRRIRSRSIMYSATASQMMTKPIHHSDEMCSWGTNTGHSSCMVGVTYGSMPMVDSGKSFAPWAKRMRGRAVIKPDTINKAVWLGPSDKKVDWSLTLK